MSFKDMLMLVVGPADEASRYGIRLAAACGATLTAAMPVIEPNLPPFVIAEMPDEILARIREEPAAEADRVLHNVAETTRSMGVDVEILPFKAEAIAVAEEVRDIARCFDAMIFQQPDPGGKDMSAIIEATLFGSGRPLIIVPFIETRLGIGIAVVAWDGGAQVARAGRRCPAATQPGEPRANRNGGRR
jgi:hypothetical protein